MAQNYDPAIFEIPDWKKINREIDTIYNDPQITAEEKSKQIKKLISEQQFETRIDQVRKNVESMEKSIDANPYDLESSSEYERQQDYLELLIEGYEKVQQNAANKL